jgi:hypothetical protein
MTKSEFEKIAQSSNDVNDYIRNVEQVLGGANLSKTEAGLMTKVWDAKNPKEKKEKSGKTNIFSLEKDGVISEFLKSQTAQGFMTSISNEFTDPAEMLQVLAEIKKTREDFKSDPKNNDSIMKTLILKSAGSMMEYFQQQTDLRDRMNREVGLTGEYSKVVREELTNANPELLRMGIGFDYLSQAAGSLIENTGRFITLNSQSWKEAGTASKAYVGTLSDLISMYPSFEKVGVGAADVAEQIEITGKRSIELGLRAQSITKDLGANIGKLNSYGFKDGIQGLAEMVRKSKEFRLDMSETFTIANKVFSPEGAIDLSANLMAIGGAIGDFNDPLKLLYMSTNNVEGLSDSLIGLAGSLATYNSEQGRFEITGINLRKARALASELNVDYNKLGDAAIAAAERSAAATDLMSRGLNLDEDQTRFLTNISTMKDGKMTIQLQGDELKNYFNANEVALDELTNESVQQLIKFQDNFKKLTSEEIIRDQATDIENIARDINYIGALLKVEMASSSKAVYNFVKESLGLGNVEKAGKYSFDLANNAGVFIKNSGDFIENTLRGDKQKTGTTENKNHTYNINHNLLIGADGTLQRNLLSDPRFIDSFKKQWDQGTYLN